MSSSFQLMVLTKTGISSQVPGQFSVSSRQILGKLTDNYICPLIYITPDQREEGAEQLRVQGARKGASKGRNIVYRGRI